jgi:hypothetical protein
MLQVEVVLRVLSHRSHASVEVMALEVGHGLKSLLPHLVFLIPNRENHDGHRGGSSEAALTLGGECDMHCLLDGGVSLAADDGSHPGLHRVVGYHPASLAHVQTINHGQAAVVDRDFPIIAEVNDYVVEPSREPRAMLAYGTQSPVHGEEDVGESSMFI